MLVNFIVNIWCSCLHQHARLHEVIHLLFSHAFIKIGTWHPEVWHFRRSCMSTKNQRLQPSSSYLRSVTTVFQRTERIHSRIVRSDMDNVMNLSTYNRASSTFIGELLYSIVRMPKMYAALSCLLSAACSILSVMEADNIIEGSRRHLRHFGYHDL
jgi:hypothetical protein